MKISDVLDEWTQALRSGDYIQGRYKLKQPAGGEDHMYCCLGVLGELLVEEGVCQWVNRGELEAVALVYRDSRDINTLPHDLSRKLGLNSVLDLHKDTTIGELIAMNDTGKSFEEIADFIDTNREEIISQVKAVKAQEKTVSKSEYVPF